MAAASSHPHKQCLSWLWKTSAAPAQATPPLPLSRHMFFSVCAILDTDIGLHGFQLTEIYKNDSTGELKKTKEKAESHHWNFLKELHDLYKAYQTRALF